MPPERIPGIWYRAVGTINQTPVPGIRQPPFPVLSKITLERRRPRPQPACMGRRPRIREATFLLVAAADGDVRGPDSGRPRPQPACMGRGSRILQATLLVLAAADGDVRGPD